MSDYSLRHATAWPSPQAGDACAGNCGLSVVVSIHAAIPDRYDAFVSACAIKNWVMLRDAFLCPTCWNATVARAMAMGESVGLNEIQKAAFKMKDMAKIRVVAPPSA